MHNMNQNPSKMKRSLTTFFFLALSYISKADVIYFPLQYSLINYSLELIYEYEVIRSPKNSFVYWGGAGVVGSFFYIDEPTIGVESAFEYRRYFKPETFKNFFFSTYIGIAYMTDLEYNHDLGLVPGLKMNHKSQLSKQFVLESYLGVSLPISYDLDATSFWVPFPMATVGIRLGICNLKRK